MIDHLGITVTDLERSALFYDEVLAVLGHRRLMDFGEAIGYGTDEPDFWISAGAKAEREDHIAFSAPDADAVRAFHATAVSLGAEELHAPRLWPEDHEGYYAGFVRDPDGNNIEAVCHSVASGQA